MWQVKSVGSPNQSISNKRQAIIIRPQNEQQLIRISTPRVLALPARASASGSTGQLSSAAGCSASWLPGPEAAHAEWQEELGLAAAHQPEQSRAEQSRAEGGREQHTARALPVCSAQGQPSPWLLLPLGVGAGQWLLPGL